MTESERRINLVVADMTFPMKIRSEREEELFRKAAKQINDKLNTYRLHFSKESVDKIMAMVALDFAYKVMNLEDQNDTAPYTEKLKALTQELEQLFGKAGG